MPEGYSGRTATAIKRGRPVSGMDGQPKLCRKPGTDGVDGCLVGVSACRAATPLPTAHRGAGDRPTDLLILPRWREVRALYGDQTWRNLPCPRHIARQCRAMWATLGGIFTPRGSASLTVFPLRMDEAHGHPFCDRQRDMDAVDVVGMPVECEGDVGEVRAAGTRVPLRN